MRPGTVPGRIDTPHRQQPDGWQYASAQRQDYLPRSMSWDRVIKYIQVNIACPQLMPWPIGTLPISIVKLRADERSGANKVFVATLFSDLPWLTRAE